MTGGRLPVNYQPQDIDNAIHRTPDLNCVALDDWLQRQIPEDVFLGIALRHQLRSCNHIISPKPPPRPRRSRS